jgi:DNA (cytosine-5)-methyltransferase 1
VDLVRRVKPPLLLLENVRGIEVEHGKKERSRKERVTGETEPAPVPFSCVIRWELEELGYHVYPGLVRAVEYGVPQWRPRVVMIGIRKTALRQKERLDPFALLQAKRASFLAGKGLPTDRPVTVSEAISDLECRGKEIVACVDSPRAQQIVYTAPRTHYQRLLHGDLNGTAPNSLRLPNHADETRYRFWCILKKCRSGVQLSDDDLEWFGLKKHCVVPLDADSPSHTLTTLPDDLLHYAEPRILTVRENARLQSFPDWYEFKGAYCTGGERRVQQCPRYTQVGNAVPPFLAEVLGLVLNDILGRVLPTPAPGSDEQTAARHGEARCP